MADGRGNTVWAFSYNGSTGQISTVTIDGHSVSYAYYTGRTERTDRLGNIHHYHFTGTQVTQTDLYVSSQAKYVTLYRWSGVFLSNVVLPRGNWIHFTFDGNGALTGQRRQDREGAPKRPDGQHGAGRLWYKTVNGETGSKGGKRERGAEPT